MVNYISPQDYYNTLFLFCIYFTVTFFIFLQKKDRSPGLQSPFINYIYKFIIMVQRISLLLVNASYLDNTFSPERSPRQKYPCILRSDRKTFP